MKLTFIGAGSTIFVKNIIGDIFLTPEIPQYLQIALYDIDPNRLEESRLVVEILNKCLNGSKAQVATYLDTAQRKEALRNATFVINTIQVGGYKPSTVADFEIPKKYGLRQTIADTLGIGGIFRGLRTIPVINAIFEDMAKVAPHAYFLNYTNPMAIITDAALQHSQRVIGLCHSVQVCAKNLLKDLDIHAESLYWRIAGINHMAWLLDVRDGDTDLYPEIKRKATEKNKQALVDPKERHHDMVRYEIMRLFGYYITESSEHNAEYTPYWIRSTAPERIEQYNIPLDEYPRRCEEQIASWEVQVKKLLSSGNITHERTIEYAADILKAIITDIPQRIHGNIVNKGCIPNLPSDAIVEVPVLVDANGFHPCRVDPLPVQCAALNQTNINVQMLTSQAAQTRKRQHVYQAALLDPLTASELAPDKIIALCDDLFVAHKNYLPSYQ